MSRPIPRPRHAGELLIDLAVVIGSLLYVRAASHYPPQGRQIPNLVGWIAAGIGALHLVAHAVPRLWTLTHGADPADKAAATEAGPEPSGEDLPAAPRTAPVALEVSPGNPRQVVLAMAWTAGLLLAVYVFGFVVAVPVFFLAYFLTLRAWRTAVASAVVMWAVTQFLFVDALAVPLPHGLV
ncbi:tripartite tricarboxylate transporter TctB family protein [Actinacidiphila guanduensis]|uniref:Tripartite tricarboxylate transporter TctB family protein n=1 Tax=Actinacidiphila guanduensis TaxID=310781 RepID=A0A1G9VG08_9ACTN|nr:tripartite tricarboxylate transporter TctB family protein [Actinacidiphila guanduensis]SDM71040.1 Tripartite tricarboxylate transporter TctB family protein [Actinacidiphila guanduensis]